MSPTPPEQPPPSQPPPSQPPSVGSSGGGSRLTVIIAVAVGVLLIAGGGIFLLAKGDDGGKKGESKGDSRRGSEGGGDKKPQPFDGELIAKMKAPDVGDKVQVPGAWVTDEVFAKTSVDSVIGVDAESGEQAWEIPLSGPVCAASSHQTAGKTAIATHDTESGDPDCNQLVVIDLESGEKVWQETVEQAGDLNQVTTSQGAVAVLWGGEETAHGYGIFKIADGEPITEPHTPDGVCGVQGFAGGPKLMAVSDCDLLGGESQGSAFREIDPKTGETVSKVSVPGVTDQVARIASTAPLVVAVGPEGSRPTEVVTVADGKVAAKIPFGDRYHNPCGESTESCFGMAVGKDAVYLSAKEHKDSSSGDARTNEIVAFDLTTGKKNWKSEAGAGRTIMPIETADDDDVIAYRLPTRDSGGEIVRIEPESGKQTIALRMPDESVDEERELRPDVSGQDAEVVHGNGKLLLPGKYVTDRRRLLGLGFG